MHSRYLPCPPALPLQSRLAGQQGPPPQQQMGPGPQMQQMRPSGALMGQMGPAGGMMGPPGMVPGGGGGMMGVGADQQKLALLVASLAPEARQQLQAMPPEQQRQVLHQLLQQRLMQEQQQAQAAQQQRMMQVSPALGMRCACVSGWECAALVAGSDGGGRRLHSIVRVRSPHGPCVNRIDSGPPLLNRRRRCSSLEG